MPQAIAKTANGAVEYRLEGEGPVVMVLNGGHCTRATRLSHERLAQHGYAVLTPSRPGYDDTPPQVGRTAQDAADTLASLLDALGIATVDVIGISAAGPTALAFAQRHPQRTRKLVMESAVATHWPEEARVRQGAGMLFGKAEALTWALVRLALRVAPKTMVRTLLAPLTTLDVRDVLQRMQPADFAFVMRLLESSRSGTGFMNDIRHRVPDLSGIRAPVLVMHSPYDKAVPLKNAQRVAAEVANCELYTTPADTHLIWIGAHADDVFRKRLAFLKA